MSRYLITGGAGFIGSHLAQRLVKLGEDVVVYDNLFSGKSLNLAEFIKDITFIEGDIRDADALRHALNGCDYVFHLAAVASVPLTVEQPFFTHDVNATGTLNVLIAARDLGVKRVVFSSSSAVYGDEFPDKPKNEAMSPCPLSPYGSQKLSGEFYMKNAFDCYGLETVSLRFFNIFGPRQDPDSEYSAVISKFITRILKDKRPVIYGDGKQSRDFTYVENAINALILACLSDYKILGGKPFNIAGGRAITLIDLIDTLEKIMGFPIEKEFLPPRQGDIRHSWADIALAQRRLGYRPGIDLYEGLKKTIAYYGPPPIE